MSEQKQERWRELAEQAAREQDPKKLLELTKQINEILDENYGSQHNGNGKPLSPSAPKPAIISQSINASYHCFTRTRVPSVSAYVVVSTFVD